MTNCDWAFVGHALQWLKPPSTPPSPPDAWRVLTTGVRCKHGTMSYLTHNTDAARNKSTNTVGGCWCRVFCPLSGAKLLHHRANSVRPPLGAVLLAPGYNLGLTIRTCVAGALSHRLHNILAGGGLPHAKWDTHGTHNTPIHLSLNIYIYIHVYCVNPVHTWEHTFRPNVAWCEGEPGH